MDPVILESAHEHGVEDEDMMLTTGTQFVCLILVIM